ncbi:MAG: helix-turn-helix transcriptional regulator [Eubacteriales bacterium]|nr:helix-turn-helix transcriptional regulator [Eubacteriales bacterium]
MLTEFGKFCRKMRIDRGELLYDMANKLGVSSAFLSRVETGRAKPPIEWGRDIPRLYELSEEESEKLEEIIETDRLKLPIKTSGYTVGDQELILSFARKLSSMSEAEKEALREQLKVRK